MEESEQNSQIAINGWATKKQITEQQVVCGRDGRSLELSKRMTKRRTNRLRERQRQTDRQTDRQTETDK